MVSYITSKGYNLEQHLKDFRQFRTPWTMLLSKVVPNIHFHICESFRIKLSFLLSLSHNYVKVLAKDFVRFVGFTTSLKAHYRRN